MSQEHLRNMVTMMLPVTAASASECKKFLFTELIKIKDVSWLEYTVRMCGYGRDTRLLNAVKIETGLLTNMEK